MQCSAFYYTININIILRSKKKCYVAMKLVSEVAKNLISD